MKDFKKYLWVLVLPLMACSTNKLASTHQDDDNVYVSNAKAREAQPYVRIIPEKDYKTEAEVYGDQSSVNNDRYDDRDDFYDDDFSYSSHIYRFRNYSPWRNYFDPWYDYRYDPFYANNFYFDNLYFRNSASWSINIYSGPAYAWYSPYYSWRYRPYTYAPYGNYWGLYSYYNTIPYYPGYYGGNQFNYPYYPNNSRTYRPRPSRGGDNQNWGNGSIYQGGTNGSRAGRYGDSMPSGNQQAPVTNGARPSRVQENSNPVRQETPKNTDNSGSEQRRPSRAERYTPPPARTNTSSGGQSDSNAKPRPARARGGQ